MHLLAAIQGVIITKVEYKNFKFDQWFKPCILYGNAPVQKMHSSLSSKVNVLLLCFTGLGRFSVYGGAKEGKKG